MSQVPSPGRIVTAVGMAARSNGVDTAPALITRIWSQRESDGAWMVNATIFRDNASPNYVTSAYLVYDEPGARALIGDNETMTALHWPVRV